MSWHRPFFYECKFHGAQKKKVYLFSFFLAHSFWVSSFWASSGGTYVISWVQMAFWQIPFLSISVAIVNFVSPFRLFFFVCGGLCALLLAHSSVSFLPFFGSPYKTRKDTQRQNNYSPMDESSVARSAGKSWLNWALHWIESCWIECILNWLGLVRSNIDPLNFELNLRVPEIQLRRSLKNDWKTEQPPSKNFRAPTSMCI